MGRSSNKNRDPSRSIYCLPTGGQTLLDEGSESCGQGPASVVARSSLATAELLRFCVTQPTSVAVCCNTDTLLLRCSPLLCCSVTQRGFIGGHHPTCGPHAEAGRHAREQAIATDTTGRHPKSHLFRWSKAAGPRSSQSRVQQARGWCRIRGSFQLGGDFGRGFHDYAIAFAARVHIQANIFASARALHGSALMLCAGSTCTP